MEAAICDMQTVRDSYNKSPVDRLHDIICRESIKMERVTSYKCVRVNLS